MPRRNSWDLRIDEVSGLGRRWNPASGRTELLAVGDRESTVATITADESGRLPLDGDHRKVAVRHPVRGIPDDLGGGRGQSDWEGVAGDADGRVFILKETGSRLLIVSPTFEFEGSVALDWDHPDGTTLESLLLLANGHFLSATQETPLRILEFAPPRSRPHRQRGWRRFRQIDPCPYRRYPTCAAPPRGRSPRTGSRAPTTSHCSTSTCSSSVPGRAAWPDSGYRRVCALELDAEWPLPDHIANGRQDRAEGLLVDTGLGALVGVDRQPGAPGPNLHRLELDAVETVR